uniref:glucan endo-1,3-beta-D-glucosidase n=1 Tax=Thraustotheca clavata TaxID=74557 RepID=A0A0A7CM78_9STRA|nr:secreted protein [Thraustotheca clavata]
MIRSLLIFVATVPLVSALGVCYDTYNPGNIDKHFQTIKSRFSSIRTYQTYLWNPSRNVIDAASDNGLTVYAGIWLRDGMDFNKEIQAVIDGAKRHPNVLQAVFVGNEDIDNNWAAWQVAQKVNDARGRLRAAGINVRVGSVQTDGAWLRNSDLANSCDIIGVNIYPFFGASPTSWTNPIQDLNDRWNAITNKFGGKAMITETGWPHGGGNFGNHISNSGNAIDYFNKVKDWASSHGGEMPMYFMFHDNWNKGGFEAQFGLANSNGDWKFDFGSSNAVAPAPAPAPAPASSNSRFQVPVQLISNTGKALREWYGAAAAKDNNHDRYTVWQYDTNTQLLKNVGSQTCLDAYKDNGQVKIHMYNCDANNGNQKWRIENSKVFHASFSNICLDADSNDSQQRAQVWSCVDNNPNQVFSANNEMQHVAFTARSLNAVFTVGNDDQVLFQPLQSGQAVSDQKFMWTVDHGKNTIRSESNGRCLDAWEARNGATVHSWNCDASNANQNWRYDATTKQLRHLKHNGYCLDMGSDSGNSPYLWQCHDTSDYWVKYQQFAYEV